MAAQFRAYAPTSMKRIFDAVQKMTTDIRDWTSSRLAWHRTSFVWGLENISRQLDRTVADYEARRETAAELLDEARKLRTDLSEQIEANEQATIEAAERMTSATDEDRRRSALDQRHQSEQAVASLQSQYDQQDRYVEELELQLTRADATLARLRSQRDVLRARLQAARARHVM